MAWACLFGAGCSKSETSVPASAGAASALAIAPGAAKSQEAGVIVVLGSSTAAGTGPSKPQNAWVERYRSYLTQNFPKFELINLAVGGYTTYQMQPSEYQPPAQRPAPDAKHNITKALSFQPNAILINLPSNDQASGFSLAEQLTNYDRVTQLAAQHGVSFWATTPQPRNFAELAQRNELIGARTAIQQKFGDHTLDFWSPFAEADGRLDAKYDSGDGTHMNDAAHALLVQQVILAKIPEAILSARH